jgi:hypothetical protein
MILTLVLVCDKIYNMENENPFGNEPLHIPSEQSDHYLPDELGLDESNEADMALYNESKGIRDAGMVLLERRKLTEAHLSGQITREHYNFQLQKFNETLEQILGDQQKEAP